MMACEEARKLETDWGKRAPLGRQRYRFVFDLENRDALGDSFECEAQSRQEAFLILNSVYPDAGHSVKTVEVIG